MPSQNPFLRRASSPGDFLNYKKRKSFSKLPALPQPAKLTQASLSDPALKVPPTVVVTQYSPDTAMNTTDASSNRSTRTIHGIAYPNQHQTSPFSVLKSRRPSRFLKLPTTTIMSSSSAPTHPFPLTPSNSSSPTPTITFSTNHSVTSSSSSSMKTQSQESSPGYNIDDQQQQQQQHQHLSSFNRLYDIFSQKLYMEGYLMKHHMSTSLTEEQARKHQQLSKTRTKMFVELCGSVITMWDAESSNNTDTKSTAPTELEASVMPACFFHLSDNTTITAQILPEDVNNNNVNSQEHGNKTGHLHYVFTLKNKTTSIQFETSDEKSLRKWVLAVRLSYFEKQKLHQLFTIQQLSNCSIESNNAPEINNLEAGTWLQIKLSHESPWQRYWVVLSHTDDKKHAAANGSKKKKKHMFSSLTHKKQQQKSSFISHTAADGEQTISIYETKKSKQPLFTLTKVTQAYAIFPESMQLIEKCSILRFECQLNTSTAMAVMTEQQHAASATEGTIGHDEEATTQCWLMADTSQLTFQWLLKVYDAFRLYGRPGRLLTDATHPDALNFGELATSAVNARLFLETEEVFYHMSSVITTAIGKQQETDSSFHNIILIKQQQQHSQNNVDLSRRLTNRANSLPLITVIPDAEDGGSSEKLGGVSQTNSKSLDLSSPAHIPGYKLTRQVVNSSDESDDNEDTEEEHDDNAIHNETNEEDSEYDDDDDELETSSHNMLSPVPVTPSFANTLIPDFDFGNGFDVSKDAPKATIAAALTSTTTNNAELLSTRNKTKKNKKKRTARHNSSIAMFGSLELEEENVFSFKGSFPLHARKASMPNPPKLKASISTESPRSLNSASPVPKAASQQSASPTPSSPELTSTATDLFGDFDLIKDFGNFLKEPSFSSSSLQPRKYSLPADVKLNSSLSSSAGISWEGYSNDKGYGSGYEGHRRPSSRHSRSHRQHRHQHHHRHSRHNQQNYRYHQHPRLRHPYDEDEEAAVADKEGDKEYDYEYEENEDSDDDHQIMKQHHRDPHYVYYQHRHSQERYNTDEEDEEEDDEDGPLIPSLGDHFAPQNSLLDTYHGEQLSAKEQIEFAKATGQPLIKLSTKKKEDKTTRGGLVGMISQREKDRKEGNGLRVAEKVNQHHLDMMEKEKERRLFEQRQQQIYQHQMMLFANGYSIPPPPSIPIMPAPFPGQSSGVASPVMNLSATGMANGTIPSVNPLSPVPINSLGPLSPLNLAMMQQQQQPFSSPSLSRSGTPPATTFLSPQQPQFNPYFPPSSTAPMMSNGHPYYPQQYGTVTAPTITSPTPYSQPASAMGFYNNYYFPNQTHLLQPQQQQYSNGERYSPNALTVPPLITVNSNDRRRRSSSYRSLIGDNVLAASASGINKISNTNSSSSDISSSSISSIKRNKNTESRQWQERRKSYNMAGCRSVSLSPTNTVTTTNSSISSASTTTTTNSSSSSTKSSISSGSRKSRT